MSSRKGEDIMSTDNEATDGITITRVFDAPRELVFRAWTTPEQFAAWYGGDAPQFPGPGLDGRPSRWQLEPGAGRPRPW